MHRFIRIAEQEEYLAAACVAVAPWVSAAAVLRGLGAEHLAAATRLGASSHRWQRLQSALRATLAAAVGNELGALVWLRKQEQRLLDAYLALERSPLLVDDRRRLCGELVPAAFDRFTRVDQLLAAREAEDAVA